MNQGLVANTVAGLAAGGASTIAMHPLDLIKTRMQVTGGSSISLSKSIYAMNGMRGLYRGLGTNLVGGMLGWGFYFAWYGRVKKWMGGDRVQLTGTEYLLSSASAGLLTSICTNPIWVVKTRMLTTNRGESLAYTDFLDGLKKIAKQEGLRGLYRGLLPSLFGVTQGAFQFTAYEKLKNRQANLRPERAISTIEYVQLSAASKLLATVITYPYQVLRSRLQLHNIDPHTSLSSTFKDVLQEHGFRGLYRGLTPNLLRVVPTTCITMVVYEQVNKFLLAS